MRGARLSRNPIAPIVLGLAAVLAAGCREGTGNAQDGSGIELDVIPPSDVGSNGCAGPDPVFPGPFPIAPTAVWTSSAVASTSRLAAALDAPELYVTLAGGALVELDITAPLAPVETELVAANLIRDSILAPAGVAGDAVISGVAVTNASTLVVMEHTGNVLVSAPRDPSPVVTALGTPSAVGGFLDGTLFAARFNFEAPADLCPSGDGRIFFPDSGNHVLRQIETTSEGLFVSTIAGTGQTESQDGDVLETAFDTPAGMQLDCANQLIVTERGDFGGGNRLRAVATGTDPFFGGVAVDSRTLAGDGAALTVEGVDEASSLAGPSAPVVTASGEAYWVDRLTGVLRRYSFSTGLADCPLDVDCIAAQSSTPFTVGGEFALALDGAGALFVLDCAAQTLYRLP